MNLKTLLNYLNPLANEAQYGMAPVGGQPVSKQTEFMLRKALGLGASWGTLALVAKGLNDAVRSVDTEHDDRIREAVKGQYSVLSPDPDLKDREKERKKEDTGLSKTAAGNSVTPEEYLFSAHYPWIDPAVSGAAILGGSVGGAKLYDLIRNYIARRRIQKRIESSKNDFDQMVYDEYARTRGIAPESLDKTAYWQDPLSWALGAADKGLSSGASSLWNRLVRGPGRDTVPRDEEVGILGHGAEGVKKVYGALAPALAVAAFLITKNYMDKRDPNRQRQKQLEDLMNERAKNTGKPVMLMDDSTFKVPGMTPKQKRTELRQISREHQTPDLGQIAELNRQLGI